MSALEIGVDLALAAAFAVAQFYTMRRISTLELNAGTRRRARRAPPATPPAPEAPPPPHRTPDEHRAWSEHHGNHL